MLSFPVVVKSIDLLRRDVAVESCTLCPPLHLRSPTTTTTTTRCPSVSLLSPLCPRVHPSARRQFKLWEKVGRHTGLTHRGPVERETWGATLRPRGEGRISLKSSDACVYAGSDRSTGSVCGEGQAALAISLYLACLIHKPILPQLPQTYLLNELNCLPVC